MLPVIPTGRAIARPNTQPTMKHKRTPKPERKPERSPVRFCHKCPVGFAGHATDIDWCDGCAVVGDIHGPNVKIPVHVGWGHA